MWLYNFKWLPLTFILLVNIDGRSDLRLVAKVESQMKATQKACAKVTATETTAKSLCINFLIQTHESQFRALTSQHFIFEKKNNMNLKAMLVVAGYFLLQPGTRSQPLRSSSSIIRGTF